MKRLIPAVIAAISCNLTFAAEPASYVSVSLGSAEQKLSVDGFDVSKSDTAFQIAGGYRMAPNVGVEVGYTNFGTGEIAAEGLSASSKPESIHLAVTGAWEVSPQFAVTGKLGIAHTRTKLEASGPGYTESATETSNSLMYGVGVSYAFAPSVAVIVDYQDFGKIVKGDGADLKGHVVSAGVRYSF